MKHKDLISKSELQFLKHPHYKPQTSPGLIFLSGAKWMHDQLNVIEPTGETFDSSTNYNFYGILKYSI